MAHKSSFDEEAKKKAIDKAMPERVQFPKTTIVGQRPPRSSQGFPKKGSVEERAATAGNMAARGLNKLSNMPTPADALKSAGKSFKKTLQNKVRQELEEEGDPKALRKKASKKRWDDRVKRGDA